ncbi:MAG TPA: hypothetical protein VGL42_15925 [Opitutaceae bacterium]|jgi:hypothetical protein
MLRINLRQLSAAAKILFPLSVSSLSSVHAQQPDVGYLSSIASEAPPAVGNRYYIRHCLRYEHGVHETTNYGRGTLVPINTRVTLISERGKKLVISVEPGGQRVTVVNVEKYSGKDLPTIARELLTRNPVSLDRFSTEVASLIRQGRPAVGMSKEQVVMARGYPPRHRTPSLESEIWVYWETRMMVATFAFSHGILTSGVNLPRLSR